MKYIVSFTHVRRHSSVPTTLAYQSEICAYGENYPEDETFDTIEEAEAHALKAWKFMERADRYHNVAYIEEANNDGNVVAFHDFWKEFEG